MNQPLERWTGRPVWAEIDLDALAHNVRVLADRAAPAKLYAVVKANAYGHGAIGVGRASLAAGAAGLAVVCVDEAEELRRAGIDAPVLIVGATHAGEAERIVELGVTPTVTTMDLARALSTFASARGATQKIHIELESGLNRNGLELEPLVAFAEAARALPGIEIEGIYTHFAAAEEGEQSFTRGQYDALIAASSRLPWIPVRHCSASASALCAPEMRLEMVRAGIAIYGYHPAPDCGTETELRPAMTLKSRIARIIDVGQGATVGYGRTWRAERASKIALVMCGYADGYRRALSNKAEVLVRGQRAPIAGRIAMDMCMADVTDVAGVVPDDEVVMMGRQGGVSVDADELAEIADTISWEMLAGIPARVPRLYVRNGVVVAVTTLNERVPQPVNDDIAATTVAAKNEG